MVAKGRGRPPKGEFKGKSAVFSTRITAELRAGLQRAAEQSGRSLSQEIERRLTDSLAEPKRAERAFGHGRNRALALLVAKYATSIELVTGKSWRRDRFTYEALQNGIEIILTSLSPNAPIELPERIAASAARMRPRNAAAAENFATPGGVAAAFAMGLLQQLRTYEEPPLNDSTNYADEMFQLPAARKALDLEGEEK